MKLLYGCLIAGAIFSSGLFIVPVYAASLTLSQALALAEQHSPMLKVAGSQTLGAQAALDTAQAYPNPEIEFGAGTSRFLSPSTQVGQNSQVTVSQPMELPSLRGARQRAAEAGIVSGAALLEDARLSLYAQVKLAFFEILRRQDEAMLAEENHALLVQIRDRVKLRVEVGESPRYELVKSEAETLTAENTATSSNTRVVQAKDRLRYLLGVPLNDEFEIERALSLSSELPELHKLRETLLLNQPLLNYSGAEAQRATAKLEQERSLRIPQPILRWSSERQPDVNLWRVSVVLQMPLWNRRSGPIGEAQANLVRAQAEQERIRSGLLGELDQAYGRYKIAIRQMYIFENGLLRDAETALKVAEAAYRHGERGILDYLDAQRVFRSTRMDYLNARYELQFSLIDIERLCATQLAGELK